MRSRAIELFLALGLAATVTACGGATEGTNTDDGEGTVAPQSEQVEGDEDENAPQYEQGGDEDEGDEGDEEVVDGEFRNA